MEEVNFDLILSQLYEVLGPIVATVVSTLMGTEVFKWIVEKTGLNISSRTVTWFVWGVVALIVWLVLEVLPLWLTLVLGLLAIGLYAGVLKPVFTRIGIARNRGGGKVTPIGGGGGGPILK